MLRLFVNKQPVAADELFPYSSSAAAADRMATAHFDWKAEKINLVEKLLGSAAVSKVKSELKEWKKIPPCVKENLCV